MSNPLKQFEKHQYMTLETFRKNGEGVKTPVWFAQDGENTIRVWTQTTTGKVKRILRDGKVRIIPSTAAGEPLGEWTDAQASILGTSEDVKYVQNLFYKKYGWMFNMFAALGKMRGAIYTTIEINVNSSSSHLN